VGSSPQTSTLLVTLHDGPAQAQGRQVPGPPGGCSSWAQEMAELDAAVLAYLRRRGYKDTTLEALKKDPKMAASPGGAVADLGSNPSLQNRILFYSTEEAHPRRYFDSYLRLRDWVHSSLDLYKVRYSHSRLGSNSDRC
jgi:hypothetical protein